MHTALLLNVDLYVKSCKKCSVEEMNGNAIYFFSAEVLEVNYSIVEITGYKYTWYIFQVWAAWHSK